MKIERKGEKMSLWFNKIYWTFDDDIYELECKEWIQKLCVHFTNFPRFSRKDKDFLCLCVRSKSVNRLFSQASRILPRISNASFPQMKYLCLQLQLTISKSALFARFCVVVSSRLPWCRCQYIIYFGVLVKFRKCKGEGFVVFPYTGNMKKCFLPP